jgi:hypothetical protein
MILNEYKPTLGVEDVVEMFLLGQKNSRVTLINDFVWIAIVNYARQNVPGSGGTYTGWTQGMNESNE